MDKKTIVRRFLMGIGFVAAGIAGAVSAGEIPENLEKAQKLVKKDYDPEEKTDDEQ